MKKILILLSVVAFSLNIYAGGDYDVDCDLVLTPYPNTSSPIEIWEENYQPCLYNEWNVTFPESWEYVDLDYIIDLNPTAAMDALYIYIEDENGQEHEVLHYLYQPIAGRITLPLYTNSARVVFMSLYGNADDTYKGFKLHYRQGNSNPMDHVFLSKVGVGTYPQEMLHVNGAIRGGGTNGEVTLKGDNGSVTIGATDAQTMTFNTDKSKYAFNINGTNRMLIQSDGNVGIGLLSPHGRLHINGGALRLGVGTSETARAANVLAFGDNSYVKIGEWQKDNMLSFMAHSFNFNVGNVGIGTITPQYKLDVVGTIRAEELIVETTGADFVFADDYELRPLNEVKAFIAENKHLPEIQSALEMQENGVSVSELQTQLLQKIEELTLYILQQEEKIQQQELRIKLLETK
jgi:hypothetical protein